MSRRSSTIAEREPSGLTMVAEAFHLLLTTPPSAAAAYLVGTLPFVLGLLYFWADMSRSGFAAQRCVAASFGLACLFIWMKCWQAAFAAGLNARLLGLPQPRWTRKRIVRLCAVQAACQPYGILLIPLSILLMLPFHAAHAFYQNLTVLGDGSAREMHDVTSRAWRQALLWPRQNFIIIWLLSPWLLVIGLFAVFGSMRLAVSLSPELYDVSNALWFLSAIALSVVLVFPFSPFGCVVAGNVSILIVVLPSLLNSLLGVGNVFALSAWNAIFNSTFLMTVCGISYLCLDPLVKSAHCLRCFYGEARATGEDLKAVLRALPEKGAGT